MADVAVIDYGMGNLHSISSALEAVGAKVELVTDAAGLAAHPRAVLPGVGAFGRSMQHLEAAGLVEGLRAHVAAGRPLLGICLGFQVLFTSSEEHGHHAGLGLVPGRVVRFETDLHVPHVGWNVLRCEAHPLFAGLGPDPHAYFVHSFYPVDVPEDVVVARSEYDGPFVCAVAKGPVLGVQFHPEKSGPEGLSMLARFLEWQP